MMTQMRKGSCPAVLVAVRHHHLQVSQPHRMIHPMMREQWLQVQREVRKKKRNKEEKKNWKVELVRNHAVPTLNINPNCQAQCWMVCSRMRKSHSKTSQWHYSCMESFVFGPGLKPNE